MGKVVGTHSEHDDKPTMNTFAWCGLFVHTNQKKSMPTKYIHGCFLPLEWRGFNNKLVNIK
jgi:hypothetical protein